MISRFRYLNGKLAKMDFENRQIIDRSLEHGFDSGAFAWSVFEKGTSFVAKDGLSRLYIQRCAGSINNTVKQLGHGAVAGKKIRLRLYSA